MTINMKNLPGAIHDEKRFVLWRYEPKPDSEDMDKVLYALSGQKAATDNPSTWATLPEVMAALQKTNGHYAGAGIVFYKNDPRKLAGVDLDNCLRQDGSIKEWAAPVIKLFGWPRPTTFTEISPSGRGLHFLSNFQLARGRKIEFRIDGEKCGVEAYSFGRYFTLSGKLWRNAPLIFGRHQEAVEAGLKIADALKKRYPLDNKKAGANNSRTSSSSSADDFVREGEGRHDAIRNFAVKLRYAGCTDREVRAGALGFNQQCCQPPYDVPHVNGIVDWILANISGPDSWETPIPFRERALPTFAKEWLPGALGDMALAVAQATETPLEVAGLMGVSVASCCLAGKAEVEVERGYSEPINLYVAPSMESGNRKTAVVGEMTRPMTEFESGKRKELAPKIQRTVNERKRLEARLDWLRKEAAKKPADTTTINEILQTEESLPVIPQVPQLWTQDVTPEKLGELMQDHQERMGIFSDEGDLFDLLAGRYSGGAPNFDIFQHGYSGSPVKVHRLSRPPVILDRPLISIGISPQPAVLERLRETPAFRGRGLLARFLFAVPRSTVGERTLEPQACGDETREAYRQLITRLIKLTPPATDDGAWQPWRLKLSDEAHSTWKQFQREVESMMREGGKLEHLRDWGSKLPGGVARLAGVFHAVVVNEVTTNVLISNDTMRAAVNLGTGAYRTCTPGIRSYRRRPPGRARAQDRHLDLPRAPADLYAA